MFLKLTIVYFKMGGVPRFQYRSVTQFLKLVCPVLKGVYYSKWVVPVWCQFALLLISASLRNPPQYQVTFL